MGDLPAWIDEQLDSPLETNKKLTQQHVVETMIDADEPFLSAGQIHQRVKPDVGKATVRNRLDELQELDIVDVVDYPDAISLYYLAHPASDWPLSPEGKRALQNTSRIDQLSVRDLLLLRDTDGIHDVVLAGFHLSAAMVGLGLLLYLPELFGVSNLDPGLISTGVGVFFFGLFVLGAERIARSVRPHIPNSVKRVTDKVGSKQSE